MEKETTKNVYLQPGRDDGNPKTFRKSDSCLPKSMHRTIQVEGQER